MSINGSVAVDFKRLLDRFDAEYDRIYDARGRVPGYREAVDEFDRAISAPEFVEILREFNAMRFDVVSSDREAAAFMFALEAVLAGA